MVGYFLHPSPVDEDQLASALLQHCAELPVDSGKLRIHSGQISFVGCAFNSKRFGAEKPSPSSVLTFNKNASIPDTELLREHLLFYCYSGFQLEILGHLSLEQYNSLYREYILTLGDVDRPDLQLAYPHDSDTVRMMRALKPYYDSPTAVTRVDRDVALAEVDRNVGLTDLPLSRLTKLEEPEVEEYLRKQCLWNAPDKEIAFPYALLAAGIEEDYAKILIKRECLLLEIRLNRYWTDERSRAVFCGQWFPDLVTVRPLEDPRSQFPCFPSPLLLDQAREDPEDRGFVDLHRSQTGPAPSMAFSIRSAYRAELGSPRWLTSRELVPELASALAHSLRNKIDELKLAHSLSLYKRLYMPIVLDKRRHPSGIDNVGSDDYVGNRDVRFLRESGGGKRSKQMKFCLDQAEGWPKKGLLHRYDRLFVMHYLCMQLYRYLGYAPELPSQFDGDENNVLKTILEQSEEPKPARAAPTEVVHELPRSRDLALPYAEHHWPACMRSLLERSKGEVHMNYTERLACSGTLKSFGYDLEQARQLWEHFFSATDVFQVYAEEYAPVVEKDYKKAKQGGCGNCKAMRTRGICPFGDLEDMGKSCAVDLEKKTGRKALYPISSPAQYFRMASAVENPG